LHMRRQRYDRFGQTSPLKEIAAGKVPL